MAFGGNVGFNSTSNALSARNWSFCQQNQECAPVQFDRITFDPAVMGGKPCIRGQRVTVGMVLGLLASGRSRDEILKAYPYLESEDIDQCLAYAAWRMEEREVPLATT